MERRALLQWMVATGGLAAFRRLSAADLDALGDDTHRRLVDGTAPSGALTAAELAAVAAAAECIIPRTETPGATDAGVAAFVDVMLGEWYPPDDLTRFRAGLRQLDAGGAFIEAGRERQVAFIQALDDEVSLLRRTSPRDAATHWYATLKYLTVWGYCTSEVAMRETFRSFPPPMRYDGAAPIR